MNLWLALAAWIGVSVPVSLALGVLMGRAKGTTNRSEHLSSLPPVSGGRLTRV